MLETLSSLSFDQVLSLFHTDSDEATEKKIDKIDMPCPFCSAGRSTEAKKHLPVFRVWRAREDLFTYYCIHCGEKGSISPDSASPIDPDKIEKLQIEARRRAAERMQRLLKARTLWRMSEPIQGTLAEQYLRSRGIGCPLPATFRFQPARRFRNYQPAMVAAYGIPIEPEPGVLQIRESDVMGVQITLLAADGSGKAANKDGLSKISIGYSRGFPIVLAPPNDGLSLAICEGLEDALSIHEARGIGAWASTGAKKLAALAPAIPAYIETLLIVADDDADGQAGAALGDALASRPDLEIIKIIVPNEERAAA